MNDSIDFHHLVDRHKALVFAVAYSATGDRALAEEIAQETFLIAWRKRDRLHDPSSAPAWLRGIARRVARNAVRRKRSTPCGAADDHADSAPSPLDDALAHEQSAAVHAALRRLPARYREPLVVFYLADGSIKDVAAALRVSETTARQRLARGRKRLRAELHAVERELHAARPGAAFVAATAAALARARTAGAVSARFALTLAPAAVVCVVAVIGSTTGVRPTPALALATTPHPTQRAQPAVVTAAPVAPALFTPPATAAATAPTVTTTTTVVAAATAPAAATAGRSRELRRGLELYRRGAFASAAIELHKVVAGETSDTDRDRQTAELYRARALYRMGYVTGALPYFAAIAEAGPAHRHYRDALVWLAAIARRQPDPSTALAVIARYPPAALTAPALDGARDELRVLLARHGLAHADPDRALAWLTGVDAGSPVYREARAVAGIAHTRGRDVRAAARAFADAARGDGSVAELALLNLARIHYTRGDYARAIEAFERVPRDSMWWPTALAEGAWAYYRAGDTARALGHVLTLGAPYFADELFPEAMTIEALGYFDHCHDRRARALTDRFERRYAPALAQLDNIVARRTDDAAFYAFALDVRRDDRRASDRFRRAARAGDSREPSPDHVARLLVAIALRDRALDRMFDQVAAIDAELRRFDGEDAAWRGTAVAVELFQELAVQRSLAIGDAGRAARQRVVAATAELRRLRGDMRRIRIELLRRHEARGAAPVPREPAPRIYAIDEQLHFWPFDGDFWRDELGRYHVELADLCPRR